MCLLQIGDYLLTMPQQLEPFTSQDNPALSHALKHGRLPFLDGQGTILTPMYLHHCDVILSVQCCRWLMRVRGTPLTAGWLLLPRVPWLPTLIAFFSFRHSRQQLPTSSSLILVSIVSFITTTCTCTCIYMCMYLIFCSLLVQCFSCPGSKPYPTALTARDTHEGRPTAVRTSSVDLSKCWLHHL